MEELEIFDNTYINIEEEISKIKVAEVSEIEGIVFFGTCHCSGMNVLR